MRASKQYVSCCYFYRMQYNVSKAIEILERTPGVLNQLLQGISEEWIKNNEGENTWSPYDVIGHLVHGEEVDWLVRTKIILEFEDAKTFEPFDRFAQFEKSKGKSIDELLKEFEQLRKANLEEFKNLNISESDLDKKGSHPGLGSVTLRNMLASWVAHDLGHITQISRVMAKQYSSEIGPWHAYLAIMK